MKKEEALRLHRVMWDWLVEHPGCTKRNAFEHIPELIGKDIDYDCFVCHFAGEKLGKPSSDYDRCEFCLLDWGAYNCIESYFGDWVDTDSIREKRRLAKIIRDLPEKIPFKKFNIKISSQEEAEILWHMLNVPVNTILDFYRTFMDGKHRFTKYRIVGGGNTHSLWEKVDSKYSPYV